MLRPGGVLRLHDLVYDFQPSQADTVFQRWLEGAARSPPDGICRTCKLIPLLPQGSGMDWYRALSYS
jgi:hypothetical protein